MTGDADDNLVDARCFFDALGDQNLNGTLPDLPDIKRKSP